MKRRLWDHGDAGSLEEMMRRKHQCNASISVVIPTLNEAATIGGIVSCIRRELMDEVAFVDELLVIDSDSSDDTVAIAKETGATVYRAREIAPERGNHPGKGENLWKSQFVSRGSIVVFLDGDVENFHRGFVTGLCLPLLDDANVRFVKAFYQRPLVRDGVVLRGEGGRVTEILVKPLLARYRPGLCSILQPLSGECAMPREVMEQLIFPHGYEVEISHLLQIADCYGVDAIAQCDLGERQHRNRSLGELSEMAHGIFQTILQHSGDEGFPDGVYSKAQAQNGACDLKEMRPCTGTRAARFLRSNDHEM